MGGLTVSAVVKGRCRVDSPLWLLFAKDCTSAEADVPVRILLEILPAAYQVPR